MLKIRLQRTGRINDPSFRIVVVEHTESPKTGSVVEQVGTYNPKTKAKNLIADRIKYWLSVGAQASGTVHNMLLAAGLIEGKKVNVLPKKSPPKKDSEPSSAEATEGKKKTESPAPATEAPKEEAKTEAEPVASEAKAE